MKPYNLKKKKLKHLVRKLTSMFCHDEIVTFAAKIIRFLNIDYFAFKTEFG